MLTFAKVNPIIRLKNGLHFSLTPAELSSFLNICYDRDIALEDLEDLFLGISEALIFQNSEETSTKELKNQLIILKKLSVLFKYMLHEIA